MTSTLAQVTKVAIPAKQPPEISERVRFYLPVMALHYRHWHSSSQPGDGSDDDFARRRLARYSLADISTAIDLYRHKLHDVVDRHPRDTYTEEELALLIDVSLVQGSTIGLWLIWSQHEVMMRMATQIESAYAGHGEPARTGRRWVDQALTESGLSSGVTPTPNEGVPL